MDGILYRHQSSVHSSQTIIMKLPEGCGNLSGKYVDLKKALYGLRQSGILWMDSLVTKLVTVHGMKQCKTDPCVFRKIMKGEVADLGGACRRHGSRWP